MEDDGLLSLWFSQKKTKDVVISEEGKVVSSPTILGRRHPTKTEIAMLPCTTKTYVIFCS